MRDKNHLFLIFALSLTIACSNRQVEVAETPSYTPDWESLKTYQVPEWYRDAKFGIYFHWGPYAVPAHKTEWYSTYMYRRGHPIRAHHESTYGTLDKFGYKDFIPEFTGEHFDADEWVDLFVQAGAQFAGPVAEHADGFAMWDSDLTAWDAKDMGPKKDIVGEMEKAVKKRGLKFILTYHRHWLYAWYPTWDKSTDAGDKEYEGLYGPYVPEGSFVMATGEYPNPPQKPFHEEWLARLDELMIKYEPDIIWFDNKMDIIEESSRKQFLATFYNHGITWNKEVVCTYKFTDLPVGTAVLDLERSRMKEKKDFVWLTDDSVDWEAWCNISNPRYKTANRLIDFLVDVVSKNGAVLLNITPRADGTIPDDVRDRLLSMGQWLKINGEAIYGTRPWIIYGEGPAEVVEGHLSENLNKDNTAEDIRFTTQGDTLYAIVLDWPEEEAVISKLATGNEYLNREINSIQLLGSNEDLDWEQSEEGLFIQLPDDKPCDHAFAFKIL